MMSTGMERNENGGEGELRNTRWERGRERGRGGNGNGDGGGDPWTNTGWEQGPKQGRNREQ